MEPEEPGFVVLVGRSRARVREMVNPVCRSREELPQFNSPVFRLRHERKAMA